MVPSFLKYAQSHGWLVANLQTLINEKYVIGHLDGNHGSLYPRKEEFVSSGIKYISANAIENNRLNLEKSKFLSDERAAKFKKGVARDGDVLFAHNATVGPVAQLKTDDEKVIISTSLTYYRVDPEKLDGIYLVQFMASSAFVRQYESIMRQTTRNQIPITTQREFVFAVPPLPEQKKIAQILSTWDQAITATERLLENSQQRKKGLMQQLLTGKKRLPGFEGEWEAKPIAQTGKIVSGGTPDTNKSDLWGGDVQWLTPTDITALKTHFIYDTPRKITEKGVKESSATLMPPGSLCVCTRASVGLMALSTTWITTNQGFKSVVPSNDHDSEFLYYLFSFNRHLFVRYSSGSTFIELSKKDFEKIMFNYPPLAEQKAIARVLASASGEIEQLQKRVDCLKQEKKALMQQLLTGKRRVQVDTEAT